MGLISACASITFGFSTVVNLDLFVLSSGPVFVCADAKRSTNCKQTCLNIHVIYCGVELVINPSSALCVYQSPNVCYAADVHAVVNHCQMCSN